MTTAENESPYASKLRDPRFLRVKAEILERDGSRCFNCGSKHGLEVRHVIHLGIDPWDYPKEMYHVICRDCRDDRVRIFDCFFNDLRSHFKKTDNLKLDQWIKTFLVALSKNGH